MKRIRMTLVTTAVFICLSAMGLWGDAEKARPIGLNAVHAQDVQEASQEAQKSGFDFGRLRNCSAGILRGRYGLLLTGTIVGLGPATEIGSVTFDGSGSLSGKLSASFNGVSVPRTVTGTYVVNPDCTGKISANITPGGPVELDLVMVDSAGNKAFVIVTTPGLVFSGSLETQ